MMMHLRRVAAAATVLAVALAARGWAQEGLYAPAVPDDAALVRVVNLDTEHAIERLDVGPVRYVSIGPSAATAYRPVPPGVYLIGGRDRGTTLSPAPGTFHTIVMGTAEELWVFEDPAHEDPARAQIIMYNASDEPASLVAANSGQSVFNEVPVGQNEAIAVNAIPIELAAVSGGETVWRERVSLSRGDSFGIFVGSRAGILHQARVATD